MRTVQIVLILSALSYLPTLVSAQIQIQPEAGNPWRFNYIGFNFGPQGDHYHNVSLNEMETRIISDDYSRINLDGYSAPASSYADVGVNLNFMMRARKQISGTRMSPLSTYRELEIGVNGYFGREIMLDYNDPSSGQMANGYWQSSSVTFCDLQNELGMNFAYKKGMSILGVINFYGGLGLAAGSTIGSQFWVFDHRIDPQTGEEITQLDDLNYDVRESMMIRTYVPAGAEVVLYDRFHFNLEGRLGLGYHQVYGGKGFSNINYGLLAGMGITIN